MDVPHSAATQPSTTQLASAQLTSAQLTSARPSTVNWKPWGGWLVRRRIAISLAGFASLAFLNVCVVKTIPENPLAFRDPFVFAALAMLALGLALRSWSAGTLNKSRELTMVGPYALVRNPLYLGSFLMMLGFAILCRDWPTFTFIVGPLAFVYWLQVRFEEERLSQKFAAQWPSYAQNTPRFFPRKIVKQAFSGWSLAEWLRNREYNAIVASTMGLVAIFGWHVWMTAF